MAGQLAIPLVTYDQNDRRRRKAQIRRSSPSIPTINCWRVRRSSSSAWRSDVSADGAAALNEPVANVALPAAAWATVPAPDRPSERRRSAMAPRVKVAMICNRNAGIRQAAVAPSNVNTAAPVKSAAASAPKISQSDRRDVRSRHAATIGSAVIRDIVVIHLSSWRCLAAGHGADCLYRILAWQFVTGRSAVADTARDLLAIMVSEFPNHGRPCEHAKATPIAMETPL